MEKIFFEISAEDSNIRLDKYLARECEDFSRSYIQKLIKKANIKVNHRKTKNSYKLKTGDIIELKEPEAEEMDLEPYPLELNIIYEDENIIVLNKEADLIVHPSPHEKEKTLVNALLAYSKDLSGIGGVKRPGIVHRLDRNTSGAIVIAKDDNSHKNLIKQFKNRKVKKIYKAISLGKVKYKKGKIDAPIGRDPNNRTKMAVTKNNSKKAITHFKVIKSTENFSYLKLKLETGRTHQIRVHLSYMGNPVLCDEKYGGLKEEDFLLNCKRQLLHSHKIGFYHPQNNDWIEFEAEIPQDFKTILKNIF